MGYLVGSAVDSYVGSTVGSAVGSAVGSYVGSAVGSAVGSYVGSPVGSAVRWNVGASKLHAIPHPKKDTMTEVRQKKKCRGMAIHIQSAIRKMEFL